ncbi:hypothetical protein BDK51DRAFT_14201, partial [Blyttiomyces helicus]
SVEVDPFVLRNEVASVDLSSRCEEAQKRAERLVRGQVGVQLAVYPLGLLMTHLGTPWAVSIPSTVFVSGLCLAWMHLRWASIQDRFTSQLSESHKVLKDALLTTYDREFTRTVGAPLADLVKRLEALLAQREEEARVLRKEIDEV